MTKIKVVTDSTVDLDAELIREYGIEIIPLSFTIDGTDYLDGVDLTPAQFIQQMKKAITLPTSSQPAVGRFVELYDRLGSEGYTVLSIHMTGNMSGTVRAAEMAAAMTDTDVTVVDSRFISHALGFQVVEASMMARQGIAIEEITHRLNEIRRNTRLFVMVDTLENLVKGGRIGKAKSLIGTLLKIKPIAALREGELVPATNMRSHIQVVKYLTKQWLEDTKGKTVKGVGIAHAEGLRLAESLHHTIAEASGYTDTVINYTSPIISTHTGAGAIGFSYYFA